MPSWIRIQIRIVNPDTDPGTSLNPDLDPDIRIQSTGKYNHDEMYARNVAIASLSNSLICGLYSTLGVYIRKWAANAAAEWKMLL